MHKQTFLILARLAPPLPNTLPTACAGINISISKAGCGGKLHTVGRLNEIGLALHSS